MRMAIATTTTLVPVILAGALGILAPEARLPVRNPARTPSLADLLPEETVAVVELTGLPRRWPEIRRLPGLHRLMADLALACQLDLEAIVPLLPERFLVAWLPDVGRHGLAPVVVLRPDDPEAALGLRRALPRLAVHRGRGALWIGPAAAARPIRAAARGDGTSVTDRLSPTTAAEHLPAGGLVRGWIHIEALRQTLERREPDRLPWILESILSGVQVELDSIRMLAFRRDLVSNRLLTDVVVLHDPSGLPPAVARSLTERPPVPSLPERLPAGVLGAAVFRPEPATWLPWIGHAAAHDPEGPLRNARFWIGEFEEGSGRDLQRDLVAGLGRTAWLLLLDAGLGRPPYLVALTKRRHGLPIEETLLDLRSWYRDHLLARSLGLLIPMTRDQPDAGAVLHGLTFWTPLGRAPGPWFAVTDEELIVGWGPEAGSRIRGHG